MKITLSYIFSLLLTMVGITSINAQCNDTVLLETSAPIAACDDQVQAWEVDATCYDNVKVQLVIANTGEALEGGRFGEATDFVQVKVNGSTAKAKTSLFNPKYFELNNNKIVFERTYVNSPGLLSIESTIDFLNNNCGKEIQIQSVKVLGSDNKVPQILTDNTNMDLGENPTEIVAPVFTLTDNCDEATTPVVTEGEVIVNGQNRSQTWTATYEDECKNAAEVKTITYTWTVVEEVVYSCDIVTFVDPVFKSLLVNNSKINTDGDEEICKSEAEAFASTINLGNKNITDLTGIEAFVNLQNLYLVGNELTSIDLSKNTQIKRLDLSYNNLTSLDLSQNIQLENVVFNNNKIETVSFNDNAPIYRIRAFNNAITELDLSNLKNLNSVYVNNNNLESFSIANGQNSILTSLRVYGNFYLGCIQHDEDFTVPTSWEKDDTAEWNANCNAKCVYVPFPDANFKSAILSHSPAIDTDGDGEICVDEAAAFNGFLRINNKEISDLRGIEAFTNVIRIYADNNSITSVDLSKNKKLQYIFFANNQLETLDLTGVTSLTDVYARSNKITTLTLDPQASGLKTVRVHNNNITELDLSAFPNLVDVRLQNNDLTSLNVANGNNSAITYLNVVGNYDLFCAQHDENFTPQFGWYRLSSTKWSTDCTTRCMDYVVFADDKFKNAILNHSPVIDTDGDGEICTTEAEAFDGFLRINNKEITDITGIEAFTNVVRIYADNNDIASVNLSNKKELQYIFFANNELETLDLTGATSLTDIYARSNKITTLTLDPAATGLKTVRVHNNNIAELDLSVFPNLVDVRLQNNDLTSLNIANGNNATIKYMNIVGNYDLFCAQHDENFTPKFGWYKLSSTLWNVDCNNTCAEYVEFTDANFKSAILSHSPAIDVNNDGEICVTEAEAFNGFLRINNKGITDLTGIEAFTNIIRIYADNNDIASVDLSMNTKLQYIFFANNQLESLDLTGLTAMTDVYARSNNISILTLDTEATGLKTLRVHNNDIENVDLSVFSKLVDVRLQNNNLVSLDVANGNNSALRYLNVVGNRDLYCVKHDENFDARAANWYKSSYTNWSTTNCSELFTEEEMTAESAPELESSVDVFADDSSIYPTLATVNQDITIEGTNIETVTVYSAMGEVVSTSTFNGVKKAFINTKQMQSGIYFIMINNEKTHKLIVR